MHALDTWALLDAWDHGHSLSVDAWALWLLRAACADSPTPIDSVARWPVGQRDGTLLRLRRLIFGSRVVGLLECPGCHTAVEFEAPTDALLASTDDAREPACFRVDGVTVTCRPVCTEDLFAISACTDLESATLGLLECCVHAEAEDGTPLTARELPESVVAAVAAHLERVDPQANVQLSMQCPACGQAWQVTFDIVLFLWRELSAWATRMLRDVHELASVYGWSEAQILSLSPARRQRYLGMLGS